MLDEPPVVTTVAQVTIPTRSQSAVCPDNSNMLAESMLDELPVTTIAQVTIPITSQSSPCHDNANTPDESLVTT